MKELLKKTYVFIIESLANFNFKARYCNERLVPFYKNLFYSPKCDIYEFRPQPIKFLWKWMHSFTLLSAYSNKEVFDQRCYGSEKTLDLIERFVPPGRIFDVGSNGGAFLYTARKRGWKVDGNEISLRAINWAKKNLGIKIMFGYFEDLRLKKNYYDAVVLWNVLEHTHDPLRVLKKVRSVLKQGGVVAIEVPVKNKDQLKKYYERFHLFEFQKKGLERMLSAVGFKPLYSWVGKPRDMNVMRVVYQK